ncbi:MAG TPA: glycoside hydrolase family 15 protein [Vulgatibacter sp.]|nr:glycoside hydrolase family 15 protein [Vulgatibacter sp.]
MARPSIDDYAIIGDCRSAALVSRDGSIDWLCWPRFDSPALFSAILDRKRGGRFSIRPVGRFLSTRRYLPDTNVLETRFFTPTGTLRLTDLMPVLSEEEKKREIVPDHELLRELVCEEGEVEVEAIFDPRPRFGAETPRLEQRGRLGLQAPLAGRGELSLRSELPLQRRKVGASGRARLRAGERQVFRLVFTAEAPTAMLPFDQAPEAIRRTARWWRDWVSRMKYDGPYRPAVARSALALRLLIYAPSGAVVAAPTTSLPEKIGAEKNWDYRYCWLRDASFIVRALFGLGYRDEAAAFVSWLLHTTRLTRPRLRVLYDVFGEVAGRERDLPLSGYRGSRPVRVGNAAQDQLQLDVYGEVIDAACQYINEGGVFDRETARMLASFGEYVCDHWCEPDEGIWEVRTGRVLHVHSQVLCWTALDRLLDLHRKGYLRKAPVERFLKARARIRESVRSRGWDEAIQSYVQVVGTRHVDAALLLLSWYGFEHATSPRMKKTWARIRKELHADGALLFRYSVLGGKREGAFGICGFWAAEYLARGGGSLQEARTTFEDLLRYGNDLGLFAEEIDPSTGASLGNFPQGFTHVGLINAALAIHERLHGSTHLPHHDLPERATASGEVHA